MTELSLKSGDILLVDDDQRNLVAFEAALGPLSRRLLTAQSGREALRLLLTGAPSVVLLDVQMPSMDGYETARLIRSRERFRHLPIIFVTAYDRDDREVIAAYKLGAVDFLFKPIVPEILRAKVSVFVALEERTAEVARQAELLRRHEARDHERRLEEERRRWEAAALRQRMEEERRTAETMSRRATELAKTIADKERAERELVRINQELEEADRRKNDFLAVLAHELRNPLSAFTAGVELLARRDIDDPVAARSLGAMTRQARQLGRLVDDLLDISRITSGKIALKRQHLDLVRLVRETLEGDDLALGDCDRHLSVDIPDGLELPVLGDPARLNQVVSNLLDNAVRYSEPGGSVWIRCHRQGGEAVLEVGDDGRGLEPKDFQRIFVRFFQHTPETGGLGLGLPLVHQLTKLHGGSVKATSAGLGKGSVFTVKLPLAPAELAVAGDREQPPPPPSELPRSRRIVVIEDNDDSRLLFCELLESWGFTVHAASDGAAGLELLLAIDPDVALVDIHLPELDGYAVARRLRARISGTRPRLVAMTGFGQPSDRERALEAGFDAHLVKPAPISDILAAIEGSQ